MYSFIIIKKYNSLIIHNKTPKDEAQPILKWQDFKILKGEQNYNFKVSNLFT